MTGTEVAQRALSYMDKYKYIYGAKGEYCDAEHIERLIMESPSYFNSDAKRAAARSKAGNYCADCSGYVCICAEYTQYGSWGLYDVASVRRGLSVVNGKMIAGGSYIPVGAVLWKSGHVGIYVGNQTVVEARSEELDVQKNIVTERDFTYCLLLPGIQYDETEEDNMVEWPPLGEVGNYIPWVGKIVNTPSVVPQISPSNKTAAAGFGLLENGRLVTVVGISNEYYRIKSSIGYYGYVHSYYVGNQNAVDYENQYHQWSGVVNGANGIVNVRTGPGTSFSQHASIPSISSGSTVDVLGEVLGNEDNRLWYQVRVLGAYIGYIRGDLVKRKISLDYTPWQGVAKSTTGTVNIRQAPTVNSGISIQRAPLKNGDVIEVINETSGDGTIWYEVADSGRPVGYCRSDLIRPNYEEYYVEWDGTLQATTGSVNVRFSPGTEGGKVPGSPFANGTVARIIGEERGSDGYIWYKIVINSYVGYCRCDLVSVLTDYPEWWASANTTTGTLNIRKMPGTNYDLIAGCPSVPNGTQMKVRSQICGTDGQVWYKIIVKGIYTGYVRGDLVVPVNTPTYSHWIGCARSTTGVVNVRRKPTTSEGTIDGYPQLRNGECFTVIGQVDGSDGYLWFYICIMGKYYGYVRSDLVSHGVPIDSETSYASWVGVAKSTNGIVNMRAAATTNSPILESLTNGTTVEVIGTQNGDDGYVWYQVKRNQNGYIRSDLVIHQSDTDEGNTFITLTCPPRGVIVMKTSGNLYPSFSSDTMPGVYEPGTYVNVEAKVITNSGTEWYRLAENHAYIRVDYIKIFEKAEYCGGENYTDWSEHEMAKQVYGVVECQRCGYHVPDRNYLEEDEKEFIRKILEIMKVPEIQDTEINFDLVHPWARFPIFQSTVFDIYGQFMLEAESNTDATYSMVFENGKFLNPAIKANWEDCILELQELGFSKYIPDAEAVAIEIGTGEYSVALHYGSDQITLEIIIEKRLTDKTKHVMSMEYILKKGDFLDQLEREAFETVIELIAFAKKTQNELEAMLSILGSIMKSALEGVAVFATMLLSLGIVFA